jgi:hypothetical protein
MPHEDAAYDEFIDQFYEAHRDRAVDEFTAERLTSYYQSDDS